MIARSVAKRYARAFFDIAGEENRYVPYHEELRWLTSLMDGDRRLRDFLENPLFDQADKRAVVETLLKKASLPPMTENFVRLLVDKRRIGLLPDIVAWYETFMDEALRQVRVQVQTAFPLSPELATRLRQRLEEATGKRVDMTVTEDRALLGGLVVRVGDTLYDGSVRTQLVKIRNLLGEER